MEEKFTQSAACAGDCSSCGSDCSIDVSQPTVTLTLDDDTEVVCAVLNIFSASNNREYIALLPLDENGQNQDGEVYLYRYSETDGGQPMLANIEEDEEYTAAADAFNRLLDSLQADEAEQEG